MISWGSSIREIYKGKKVPKSIESLESVGIKSFRHLIWTFPRACYPIDETMPLQNMQEGMYVRFLAKIKNLKKRPIFRKRLRLFNVSAVLESPRGNIQVTWFNAYPNVSKKIDSVFSEQSEVWFEGKIQTYGMLNQIVNPKISEESNEDTTLSVYPVINKVRGTTIQKLIQRIPDELWNSMTAHSPSGLMPLKESLKTLHGLDESIEFEKALERVKFQEFFWDQLKFSYRQKLRSNSKVKALEISNKDFETISKQFKYDLTDDQKSCLKDIQKDLTTGRPLLRLVQGDVGCGKTTIAIGATKMVHDSGFQVAFMAPTENLANQQFETYKEFFPDVMLLTSSVNTSDKNKILQNLKDNKKSVIVGTHSLFQESVVFSNLGLCIIDEQHKFGVNQRISLVKKAILPHCLLMTATPIPRSLRLTQFGDLDVSIVKQMPSNRKGFKTKLVEDIHMEKYLSFFKTRINLGEQAYIILPNIEANEERKTRSLQELKEFYSKYFPNIKIEILHGKLDSKEQFEIISKFKSGDIKVLISTTVVEVGIHVPKATIMTIYFPELFGLSSLHQLRGRVGRDQYPGFCFLISENELNPDQKQRLQSFEKVSDGFKISELDLEFRGEGDLFGKVQSGAITQRKVSHPLEDYALLKIASTFSEDIIKDTKTFNELMKWFTIEERKLFELSL